MAGVLLAAAVLLGPIPGPAALAGRLLAALLALLSLGAAVHVCFFAFLGIKVRNTCRREELFPKAPRKALPAGARTRCLVLVPAHNEAEGLAPTVRSLLATEYPEEAREVIVIADNCTDGTAAVARAAGAKAWVRDEPEARGKGQALAWAFRRAAAECPEAELLVVVDADTVVVPLFLGALDAAYRSSLAAGEAAVAFQGRYDFAPAGIAQAGPGSGWFDTLTIASKAAENAFVYAPRSALGLVTLLQGNGFAVSRAALERAPFAAGSIVEDAEYALTLAFAGVRVRYLEQAAVISRMTARVADAAPQRLRWASGVLRLLRSATGPLLRQAVRARNWRLAEAAAMLLLTSRLLLLYLLGAALLSLPLAWGSPWLLPLSALLGACCLLQAVYGWLVLRHAGPASVPFRTLCCLPAYLGLLGLAQGCAALGMRRGLWHRTVR